MVTAKHDSANSVNIKWMGDCASLHDPSDRARSPGRPKLVRLATDSGKTIGKMMVTADTIPPFYGP